MELRLIVVQGGDRGMSYTATAPRSLIGRGDGVDVRLGDDTVSWEHAAVELNGAHWYIANLAAVGTSVNGARVTTPLRLRHNDRIGLSSKCELQVELLRPDGRPAAGGSRLVPWVAGLLVVAAAAWFMLFDDAGDMLGGDGGDFRQAYAAVYGHLARWEAQGTVPAQSTATFADAWRLEQGGRPAEAALRWAAMWSLLRSTPVPEALGRGGGERYLTELYSGTPAGLVALMDAARAGRADSLEERTLLDAMLRFIARRVETTSQAGGAS